MTAFASLSAAIAAASAATAEPIFWYKDGRVAGAAAVAPAIGRMTSMWQYQGFPMGAGAAPGGTARNPTRTTNGAIQFTNPAAAPVQKFLLSASAFSSIAGVLYMFDRLADISGFSGTVTTAQNTTSLAVTRYTSTAAAGNQIWIEIFTQIGASSTTITASYTNQAGTAGQTTPAAAIGNTGLREAQRMIPLALAAGDTGVRSVQSVTLAGTTGTAGDFGVVIARPLFILPASLAGTGGVRDFIAGTPPIPEILTDACLFPAFFASSTSVPQWFGNLGMAEN